MLFIKTNFFLLDFHSGGLLHFRREDLTWSEVCNHRTLAYCYGKSLLVTNMLPLAYLPSGENGPCWCSGLGSAKGLNDFV